MEEEEEYPPIPYTDKEMNVVIDKWVPSHPRAYFRRYAKTPLLSVVWGPFSIAQPHVVRWRDDLTRPGFFLGSCV